MNNNQRSSRINNEICLEISTRLAPYAAGELSAQEFLSVENHLNSCTTCAAELARELFLRQNLAGLPEMPCPENVTRSVLAAIEDGTELPVPPGLQQANHQSSSDQPTTGPSPRSRQWTSYLGWVAAAAAAFILFFNPLDRLSSTGEDSPQFSTEEIATARQDAARGLLLALTVIDQAERSTVQEVFGQQLPRSITNSLNRSIKNINLTPEGEQG